MNDASSPGLPTNPEAGLSNENEASTAAAGDGSTVEQQKKSAQKAQKMFFLDNLIRNLDIVTFCQLSILYYMDCSLFKFLLRALPHWFFFTPKPDILPPSPTSIYGPYIGAIFGSNIFCILLHALVPPPAAGEASRGYLHGGMIIDFVGQASPVGRWKLIGLDLLCLVLQVTMMSLTLEKQFLQGKKRGHGSASRSALEASQVQDLDAEERGVLGFDSSNGIELQELRSGSQGRTGADEDRERDELLGHELQEEERDEHPLDTFYAGDHVLVKLHLLDSIRAQWRVSSLTAHPANAAATTASMQTAAGDFVGRRIAFSLGGRTIGPGSAA